MRLARLLLVIGLSVGFGAGSFAPMAFADGPKRLLLLGQQRDNHPPESHEYMAGLRVVEALLAERDDVDARIVEADHAWADSENLLETADGVVVFLSQGALWLSANDSRLAAMRRLAERGGGLSVLHWGMGTKPAEPIEAFVALFGACHGGPDRRYRVLETRLRPTNSDHAITRGVQALEVHDEFYYRLKFPTAGAAPVPLVEAQIEDAWQPVSWAWERGDGGRSFGFSGLHFHKNWKHESYRRLTVQGILWSVGLEIPESGVCVDVDEAVFRLP